MISFQHLKQYGESITTGTYTNATIASYLASKNVETMSITGGVTTNPYTSNGDYLIIYKLPLEDKLVPSTITWNGRKDTSDNIVLLYTDGAWEQIDTITSSSNTVYSWELTDEQKSSIATDSVYIAFFSIKNGGYAGIFNANTTPLFSIHLMNQAISKSPIWGRVGGLLYQVVLENACSSEYNNQAR